MDIKDKLTVIDTYEEIVNDLELSKFFIYKSCELPNEYLLGYQTSYENIIEYLNERIINLKESLEDE